jgi:endonuclease III-like uncharacterized protein
MRYITNECGDVKVRTVDGADKWLPKHLVNDITLMKAMHLTIVEAPKPFCEDLKIEEKELTEVAEVTPAKRGRTQKK